VHKIAAVNVKEITLCENAGTTEQVIVAHCGYLAVVPLGFGNAASDPVISHSGKAEPCRQHGRQISSHYY
jgi:hypothetical protein